MISKSLSLVIPCNNEEQNINNTLDIYSKLLKNITKKKIIKEYEIIVVNNGSLDNTEKIVKNFLKFNKKIKLINLVKNYGYTASFMAGMYHSKKEIIITVTADLHEDPDIIIDMINLHYKNNLCVLSIYRERHEGFLKNFFADCYYLFMNIIGIKILKRHNDFRLITNDINSKIFEINEGYIFLRVAILKLIKNYNKVFYVGRKRKGGKSKFNFFKSFNLAFDSIVYYINKKILNLFHYLNLIILLLLTFILTNSNILIPKYSFAIILVFSIQLFTIFLTSYIKLRLIILRRNKFLFKVKNIFKSGDSIE